MRVSIFFLYIEMVSYPRFELLHGLSLMIVVHNMVLFLMVFVSSLSSENLFNYDTLNFHSFSAEWWKYDFFNLFFSFSRVQQSFFSQRICIIWIFFFHSPYSPHRQIFIASGPIKALSDCVYSSVAITQLSHFIEFVYLLTIVILTYTVTVNWAGALIGSGQSELPIV